MNKSFDEIYMKGLPKIIVIEGGEGAGKGVVINSLRKRFRGGGFVFAREPGGTELGEKIRKMLLDVEHFRVPPSSVAELLLFSAARAQLVTEVIAPALAAGQNVIIDRSFLSTFAYQIFGRGLKNLEKEFWKITRVAISPFFPDFILYLDVEPRVGLARRLCDDGKVLDRIDLEKLPFHETVHEGYRAGLKKVKRLFGVDVDIIDTNCLTPEQVCQRSFDLIQQFLKK